MYLKKMINFEVPHNASPFIMTKPPNQTRSGNNPFPIFLKMHFTLLKYDSTSEWCDVRNVQYSWCINLNQVCYLAMTKMN
jgi:hypothetical protein